MQGSAETNFTSTWMGNVQMGPGTQAPVSSSFLERYVVSFLSFLLAQERRPINCALYHHMLRDSTGQHSGRRQSTKPKKQRRPESHQLIMLSSELHLNFHRISVITTVRMVVAVAIIILMTIKLMLTMMLTIQIIRLVIIATRTKITITITIIQTVIRIPSSSSSSS